MYTSIEKLIIPSQKVYIDDLAFDNCKTLHELEITANSKYVVLKDGQFSFMENFIIKSDKIRFEDLWCYDTKKLKKIILSPSNKDYIFKDDKYLLGKTDKSSDDFDILLFVRRDIETVTIPSNIKVISSSAFQDCIELKKVNFEENFKLTSINFCAFVNTVIEYILIPSSVTNIGLYAFSDCKKLHTVEISQKSQFIFINEKAFQGSSVENLIINSRKTDFDKSWCYGANKLKKIVLSPNNKDYIFKDDKYLLGKTDKSSDDFDILLFARRDIETVTIPSNIKVISSFTFHLCNKLKTINFPLKSKLLSIGQYSFSESSIEYISIPSSVIKIKSCAFYECNKLRAIDIPQNSELVASKDSTFSFSIISSLTIPSHVNMITKYALNVDNIQIIEFSERSQFQFAYKTISENYSFKQRKSRIMVPFK